MPFGSQRADLLERSLQGHKCTDQEVCDLAATAGRILALTSPACAPRPEFVSALGIQLREESRTLAAREVRPISSATGARRSTGRPMVFLIGRGLPRVLAGATASLLLVGAVIGGASRSALPGGLLYPVKALLDSAAVRLAGSDFDRGTTLLSQAQEHIGDARALVDRDGAETAPASVDEALRSAHDAVSGGQRALLGDFDRTGTPQALIAVQDFVARALPQLYALRPLVPADSRPDVDALIALLQETRATLARKIAVCGQPCASLGGNMLGSSPPLAPSTGLPSTLTTGVVPAPGLTAAITGPGGVVLAPSIPQGAVGGQPLPTSDGGIGVTLPSVTLPSASILPSVAVPLVPVAPLLGVGASVLLP
ncbi:MAG: hypothetical protein ACYDC9_04890 [Dermatophilaceae bacterium]